MAHIWSAGRAGTGHLLGLPPDAGWFRTDAHDQESFDYRHWPGWLYLAEFLLGKGMKCTASRRASLINTQRIDHLYADPQVEHARLRLHTGT
jgi:hypothetical protein